MKDHCKDCVHREKGVFSGLHEGQVEKIACIMDHNRYRKKQVLFLEGNASHFIYAIKSGIVKIFKTAEDGKTHIMRVLSGGDFVGFDAVYNEEYLYSAETIEDSEICMMKKEDFNSLLHNDAEMAVELIKVLTRELDEARCFIRDLTIKTASQKVARFLLSPNSSSTPSSSAGRNITLPLSRRELAEMLGLTPETISRTLSRFEKERIVKVNGRDILITDHRRLSSV